MLHVEMKKKKPWLYPAYSALFGSVPSPPPDDQLHTVAAEPVPSCHFPRTKAIGVLFMVRPNHYRHPRIPIYPSIPLLQNAGPFTCASYSE